MHSLLVNLSGPPHDMGVQHGRLLKEQIHFLTKERFALAMEHAGRHGMRATREACLRLAHAHIRHQESYSTAVHEEFEGIAKGAQISLEELLIAQALADFADVFCQRTTAAVAVGGCTAFAVRSSHTVPATTLIGQTWDVHASTEPFVRIIQRNPDDGPRTLALATAGSLSLIGINEVGVSICTNHLPAANSRPGVTSPAIVHEALRHTHFGAACRAVSDARRSTGQNYLMADGDGTVVDLETTADDIEPLPVKEPYFVHANHYLSPRLQPLEGDVNPETESSRHRQERLRTLFTHHAKPVDLPDLQAMLADRDGGEPRCLCQEGVGRQPRTCAFVVLAPERRTLWMTLGPPSRARLLRFGVS